MKLNIQQKTQFILYVFATFGLAVVLYLVITAIINGQLITTVAAQQQDPFLSQRLNRIEQRFTTIESRIIQLEQQTRYTAPRTETSTVSEAGIRLLRSEIDALRLRVGEAECGLLKLDERTLSSTLRQAQKKSGAGGTTDICRQSPNIPLQLSARP